jgi:hypothetical protein
MMYRFVENALQDITEYGRYFWFKESAANYFSDHEEELTKTECFVLGQIYNACSQTDAETVMREYLCGIAPSQTTQN